MSGAPLLQRLAVKARQAISFEIDGQACTGFEGDTVLTAVLAQGTRLRDTEFSQTPRAGFCLMGACQDCWMDTACGQRLRACSSELQAGMRLITRVC